jgi:hypothetical protein
MICHHIAQTGDDPHRDAITLHRPVPGGAAAAVAGAKGSDADEDDNDDAGDAGARMYLKRARQGSTTADAGKDEGAEHIVRIVAGTSAAACAFRKRSGKS